MNEKTERNQRLYLYHLQHPTMSYAKIGKRFRHRWLSGKKKPLDASAVYRIIKREEGRLEIDSSASRKEKEE